MIFSLRLLPLVLLALAATVARAQLVADPARGLVGHEIALTIRTADATPWSGTLTVTATMRLSNPTVFFPDSITAVQGDDLAAAQMTRVNDSTYHVAFTLVRPAANPAALDTLVRLYGEALAGSDSICIVAFDSVFVDAVPVPAFTGTVVTESIGPKLPYVRFAILEQNYPNPASPGRTTSWAYRIDKRSDVRFEFYDLLGKQLHVELLGVQDLGPHLYIYHAPPTLPAGAYLVRLVTNSGTAEKVMHILR